MSRRKGLAERLRWRIAALLNKLPGQCWADLVTWALGRSERRSPWSPNRECHRSAAESRHGCCYCNKVQAPEPVATGGASDG